MNAVRNVLRPLVERNLAAVRARDGVAGAGLERDVEASSGGGGGGGASRLGGGSSMLMALDEAAKSADKLAESLQKDVDGMHKLLKEQNVSFMRKVFGEAGTDRIRDPFDSTTLVFSSSSTDPDSSRPVRCAR